MINNILGQLEFHATVFTADKDTPTMTQMDALNFAQVPIGTSINVNTSIKAINGAPAPARYYNTSFASQFHTYKVRCDAKPGGSEARGCACMLTRVCRPPAR